MIGGGGRPSGCRSVKDSGRSVHFLKRLLTPSSALAYSCILPCNKMMPFWVGHNAKMRRKLHKMINQYYLRIRAAIGSEGNRFRCRPTVGALFVPHNSKRSTYAFFFLIFFYFLRKYETMASGKWRTRPSPHARPIAHGGRCRALA